MRSAIGMEDDVSQNPDVNGLDKYPGDAATAPKYNHWLLHSFEKRFGILLHCWTSET